MTENFRALAAVLVLSIPTLLLLRGSLTAHAIHPSDYRLRMTLWLGLTTALFLAYSFWLFVLVVMAAVLVARVKDSNPVGLYFFLLLLAPAFQAEIPGFAGINNFLAIDYLRILSVFLLLPTALSLARDPQRRRLFGLPADKYLLGYLLLLLLIQLPYANVTIMLRSALSLGIDVLLPYYVFSRGLYDMRRLRDALASFTAACTVLAVIAIFEFVKGWLLYSSLPGFLGITWGFGGYMMRDGGLRANATLGHSIVLGYVMTVALALHMAVRACYPSGKRWGIIALLLVASIGVSISRGPWVGAAIMVTFAILLAPGRAGRLVKLGVAAVVGLPLLALTSVGPKLFALLPFVGSSASDSVDYRQQLFEVSWNVLMLNPLLGSPTYMANSAMEQLRQGEGIVDMVNSYLGIALASGLVGLFLFSAVFLSSGLRLFVLLVRNAQSDSEEVIVGRGLLAALVGMMVIIATVSSIGPVPVIYWCLAGALAAFMSSVGAQTLPVADPGFRRGSTAPYA